MDDHHHRRMGDYHSDKTLLMGCGTLVLIGIVGLIILAAWRISQERWSDRYPGAVLSSSHSNYSGLPYQFRWDSSYRTRDSFTDVYNWYSTTFDLGSEARANNNCIVLYGVDSAFNAKRYMSVLLCQTPTERLVFVTRSTSLK